MFNISAILLLVSSFHVCCNGSGLCHAARTLRTSKRHVCLNLAMCRLSPSSHSLRLLNQCPGDQIPPRPLVHVLFCDLRLHHISAPLSICRLIRQSPVVAVSRSASVRPTASSSLGSIQPRPASCTFQTRLSHSLIQIFGS